MCNNYSHLSLSSSILDANEVAATLYLLLAGLMQDFDNGADNRRGVAPFLMGVDTGNALSNCSGLNLGPNDTRFLCFLVVLGCSRCILEQKGLPSLSGGGQVDGSPPASIIRIVR